MISDSETEGGAAIGTSRLAQGLVSSGNKVTRLVERPDKHEHSWDTELFVPFRPRKWVKYQKKTRKYSIFLSHILQKLIIAPFLRRKLKQLKPDIINVNNLHRSYLWPDIVSVCTEFAPTTWTLRDMWSFTGRCAYSYDCSRFIGGCDESCPTPTEYPPLGPNGIKWAWNLRRTLFENYPDIVAISPSKWLSKEANVGLWRNNRVEIIPHGISLADYTILDRTKAREALGIETTGIVIGTAAYDLNDKRKGVDLLFKALHQIISRPITIVTIGKGNISFREEGIAYQPMGYMTDQRMKLLFFNALDLFIHPSLGEAWGHTVLESISCGTPVVGFPLGGLIDMVIPDKTGWLTESVTSESLAISIDTALQKIMVGDELRDSCREVVEEQFSVELQSRRYIDLFNDMIN